MRQDRKAHDDDRPTANERGYTARWARYRAQFLREHPMCMEDGCTEVAVIVDHIVPVYGKDDPLFWEPTNHQSLCFSDHEKKKAREKRAEGR